MKNRQTRDYLDKKGRWDEQEEMEQHYGGGTGTAGSEISGKDKEGTADAMASRLMMSPAERLFVSRKPLTDGSGLPWYVRKKMERLFNFGFGSVKIYTGGTAAAQNQKQSSLAYTEQNKIYFSAGKYNPYTLEGQQLLAHELAHVVQQKNSESNRMTKYDGPPLTSQALSGNADFKAINEGTRVFTTGSKGASVTILQQALTGLGYSTDGDAKGVFGAATDAAVKKFQSANGLKPDGVFGQTSVRMLDYYLVANDNQQEDINNAGGDSYVFNIPVAITDIRKGTSPDTPRKTKEEETNDFLLKTLSFEFGIRLEQAQGLVESGWHWTNNSYIPVSDSDAEKIDKGIPVFKKITTSKKSYESVMGKQSDGPGSENGVNTGAPGQMGEKSQGGETEDTSSVIQTDLERLFKVSADLYTSYETDASSAKVKDGLIAAGFTSVDDFAQTVKEFKEHFEAYSVLQVFRLLDNSKKETTIEQKRYSTDNGVKSLMDRLKAGLEAKYNSIDARLLDALNKYKHRIVEDGGTLDEVNGWEYALPDYGSITLSGINSAVLKSFSHKDIQEIYKLSGFFFINVIMNNGGFSKKGAVRMTGDVHDYVASQPGVKELTELFKEEEAFEIAFVNDNAVAYPIIADPSVFEKLRLHTRSTSAGALQTELGKASSKVLESIGKMQETFRDPGNYEKVWELSPVLLYAQSALNIAQGSTPELIIQKKLESVKSKEFWINIGLAALGIGLAIASVFTAGATAAVLIGLGAATSAVDLYRTYSAYSFQKDAHNTNFDRKKALSEVDPSIIWVVIAAVGLGLDFLSVLKALKGLKVAKDLKETIKESAAAMRAAKELSGEEAKILEFEEKLKKAAELNPAAFTEEGIKSLMASLEKSPHLLDELENVKNLFKSVGLEDITEVYRFYTGTGLSVVEDLPKLTDMVTTAGINDKALLTEIFTQRTVQKVMLDHADDPQLMQKIWNDFTKPRKTPLKSKTLADYLRVLKYDTKLVERTTLFSKFGADFVNWTDEVKKLKLLETTEPDLAKQIREMLADPSKTPFSKNLTQKLKEFFEKPLEIKDIQTATVQGTRSDVVKPLNRILAEESYDFMEVKKIISSMEQNSSGGSIFEHWVRKTFNSQGNTFVRLADNTLVKIDDHVVENGYAVFREIKSYQSAQKLEGHALEQLGRYEEIMLDGIKFGDKKLPIKFEYIFSTEEAAIKNKDIIIRTLKDHVDIFYITKAGKKVAL